MRREHVAAELRSLATGLSIPAPDPDDVVAGVMDRLESVGEPAASRMSRVTSPVREKLENRRPRVRSLVAAMAAILLVTVLTPPVRAAVTEWLGLGGVDVRPGPAIPSAPPPPQARGDVELGTAAGVVPFDPVLPSALGPPDGVEIGAGDRMLSLSWAGAGGRNVRLDEFAERLVVKFAPDAGDGVDLGDVDGLWFAEPHRVQMFHPGRDGSTEQIRPAGPTLVWKIGQVTLRLEGVSNRDRAIEIARSTLPPGQ